MTDPRTGYVQYGTPVSAAQRERAARAYAQWHLGDPDWYDVLQAAAADPEATLAALKAEGYTEVEEEWG